mmetsp:Transcript_3326/g.4105  ORF Transcript_3326/g.4105 Transcript_3326/m.4105 type:complete len:248 (-) Transcript_3326:42-785(-)
MGAVNRDASGMVTLQDFLKIFKVVTKHSKKQITKFKTENNDKRRKHLKDGDDEAYRECISQQITQEEAIYQEVATEVLSYLEIDEQEFMMAQNMHAMNPAFQKVMMEMQLGVEDGTPTKPSVTKEQAKEIFIFVEEEKSKAMENMRGAGMAGMNPNNMESTITMIVEHSKVGDKLFEKYGIEEEEFAKCIQYYNLVQDPDIQKLMQKSLMSMGPEALNMIAQMQGGGMGPPGGAPGGPGGNPFGAGF